MIFFGIEAVLRSMLDLLSANHAFHRDKLDELGGAEEFFAKDGLVAIPAFDGCDDDCTVSSSLPSLFPNDELTITAQGKSSLHRDELGWGRKSSS